MTDTRIRKNEKCVVGLPACDYVFSSTRSCFIAYAFQTSNLEKDILRDLLEHRGIEAVEAGDRIEPGKYAFCTKICSKIITAQFCIILMNHDTVEQNGDAREIPNANVNMEYGLMLGHNKYVIPFQRDSQKLPFNISGLDTIKYNQRNFSDLAARAIDQAINETAQAQPITSADQILGSFLLINDAILVNVNLNQGERSVFDLGSPLGYNLLMKFDGLTYIFLGNFPQLRTEAIIWRATKLANVISARMSSMQFRIDAGLADDKSRALVDVFAERLEVWLIVNTSEQRLELESWVEKQRLPFRTTIFDMLTVTDAASKIP